MAKFIVVLDEPGGTTELEKIVLSANRKQVLIEKFENEARPIMLAIKQRYASLEGIMAEYGNKGLGYNDMNSVITKIAADV